MIKNEVLSVDEADIVFCDLMELDSEGSWDTPAWAKELGEHMEVLAAHPAVMIVAWRAVARAYKTDGTA